MALARRIVRQWRWWAVALALLTIHPFLTNRLPGGALDVSRWTREIQRLEALARLDPAAAERGARALPFHRLPGELQARLLALQLRCELEMHGRGRPLDAATKLAFESRTSLLAADVAAEVRRHFGVLLRDSGDLDASLPFLKSAGALEELVVAHARRKPPVPAEVDAIVREIAERHPDRVPLVWARVKLETDGPAAALRVLETVQEAEASLLRAWCLHHLGRHTEAAVAARAAGAEGLYLEAESLRRIGSPGADEPAVILLRSHGPRAPLGHLVLGRSLLDRGDDAGWLHVAEALPALSSDALVRTAPVDRAELYETLKLHASSEHRGERLRRPASVFRLWSETFPGDLAALSDAAGLAAEYGAATGDPDEARRARREAAHLYGRLAARPGQPHDAVAAAVKRCAAQLLAAGAYEEAATAYRTLFTLESPRERSALYYEGLALAQGGQLSSALAKLEEYTRSVPTGDALVPRAGLERARIMASMGDPAALAEVEQVFTPGRSITPDSDDWREALLLKARLLARSGGRAAARRILEEYLGRYDRGPDGAAEPGISFVRIQAALFQLEEGRSAAALALLERTREALQKPPTPGSEEEAGVAAILLGDGYIALGRPAEARLAYELPARLCREPGWRVIALVGRARASLKLGDPEQAKRDRLEARKIREGRPEACAAAYPMLRALERETTP